MIKLTKGGVPKKLPNTLYYVLILQNVRIIRGLFAIYIQIEEFYKIFFCLLPKNTIL